MVSRTHQLASGYHDGVNNPSECWQLVNRGKQKAERRMIVEGTGTVVGPHNH